MELETMECVDVHIGTLEVYNKVAVILLNELRFLLCIILLSAQDFFTCGPMPVYLSWVVSRLLECLLKLLELNISKRENRWVLLIAFLKKCLYSFHMPIFRR